MTYPIIFLCEKIQKNSRKNSTSENPFPKNFKISSKYLSMKENSIIQKFSKSNFL